MSEEMMDLPVSVLSNEDLLDHFAMHVVSGEYHPEETCCNHPDAREEVLHRMDVGTGRRVEA